MIRSTKKVKKSRERINQILGHEGTMPCNLAIVDPPIAYGWPKGSPMSRAVSTLTVPRYQMERVPKNNTS